jgi:predicted enzyme related to lactoylglutathione lyase
MGRPVVHFEIGGRDRAKSAEFYGELFGWTTQEMGEASMIDTGAGSGIPGHFSALGHEPFHYVTVYVDVEDVAASLAKAESLGGKTLIPPVEIPRGTFAWFHDLDGNVIGLWHAKSAA